MHAAEGGGAMPACQQKCGIESMTGCLAVPGGTLAKPRPAFKCAASSILGEYVGVGRGLGSIAPRTLAVRAAC